MRPECLGRVHYIRTEEPYFALYNSKTKKDEEHECNIYYTCVDDFIVGRTKNYFTYTSKDSDYGKYKDDRKISKSSIAQRLLKRLRKEEEDPYAKTPTIAEISDKEEESDQDEIPYIAEESELPIQEEPDCLGQVHQVRKDNQLALILDPNGTWKKHQCVAFFTGVYRATIYRDGHITFKSNIDDYNQGPSERFDINQLIKGRRIELGLEKRPQTPTTPRIQEPFGSTSLLPPRNLPDPFASPIRAKQVASQNSDTQSQGQTAPIQAPPLTAGSTTGQPSTSQFITHIPPVILQPAPGGNAPPPAPPPGPQTVGGQVQPRKRKQKAGMAPKFELTDKYNGERGRAARNFLDRFKVAVRAYDRQAAEERQIKGDWDDSSLVLAQRTWVDARFPVDLTPIVKAEKFLFLCEENAQPWAKPYMDKIESPPANLPNYTAGTDTLWDQLGNWNEFTTAFINQFDSINQQAQAENAIDEIEQRQLPIAEFTQKFRELLLQTEWDDAAARFNYVKKLNIRLQQDIAGASNAPDDLQQFFDWVVTFGERIETARKRARNQASSSGTIRGSGRRNNNWNQRNNSNDNRRSIQANATTSSNDDNTVAAVQTNLKNIQCYNCGRMGHMASTCRSPKKSFRGNKRSNPGPPRSGNRNQRAAGTGLDEENERQQGNSNAVVQHASATRNTVANQSMDGDSSIVLYERRPTKANSSSNWRIMDDS